MEHELRNMTEQIYSGYLSFYYCYRKNHRKCNFREIESIKKNFPQNIVGGVHSFFQEEVDGNAISFHPVNFVRPNLTVSSFYVASSIKIDMHKC